MARRCGRAALLVSTLAVGVAVAAEEEGSCAAWGSCGEASLAFRSEALGLAVDVRRMRLEGPGPPAERAFAEMAALEAGAIANPDEGRRVGHYWLRSPELAPEDVRQGIVDSWASIDAIAAAAASADLDAILVVGIGGSALGPQLLSDALGPGRGPRLLFLDNTDPDGFDRVLGEVSPVRTWTVIVSKSGSTVETSNGMVEVQARYARAGVDFASRAVAVTCRGSLLDQLAVSEGWRARVPIWDWVGGRTSATSAVGLLPMALQGLDWRAFLAGAAACDGATREEHPSNPAWLLARSWYDAGGGNGSRAMVVLPYKDRLLLLGRYLQQLVMESLGKRTNLAGEVVHQGLTVYGNKGSSDQHAFVQQLRDGPDDFFVCFVNVLEARRGPSVEVAPGATSGDYLLGFLLGTRRALSAAGRRSLTLTLRRLDAFRLGALLALFERAVGLYAALIGINAYHQPGVEAGKRAASEILSLMKRVRAGELLEAAEEPSDDVELIRAHLRANGG